MHTGDERATSNGSFKQANPSNINFKLRQLVLLSALAETGTLSAAAERINVSQPGATRLLKELEDMLGVTLFDRVRGKMIVTPAGQNMISQANALQSQMLHAFDSTQDAAIGNGGHVRLGIFDSLSPEILASALREFEENFPRIRLSIVEAPQRLLIGALRRYELDAVAGRLFSDDNASATANEFDYEILYLESFSIVCGVQNELASRADAPGASELVNSRWILAAPGSALRHRVDTYFREHTGAAPQGAFETRSVMTHLALLTTSDYLGVLPSRIARFFEKRGELRVLVPDLNSIEGAVSFITMSEAALRPVVASLRDTLRKASLGSTPSEQSP